jgi:hypothetical protein
VRWIDADLRDGPRSAKLDDLAGLRHQESRVKIYARRTDTRRVESHVEMLV